MTQHDIDDLAAARRGFLQFAGALTAAASAPAWAQAAPPDYKALVCVFMLGGNDGHNLLVPTGASAYAAYRAARAGLALPDGTAGLLPVSARDGTPYALNSGLTAIAPLWAQGRLAAVATVGPLIRPTTRAQYLAGTVNVPSNLFSHSDQIQQAQAGNGSGGGTGCAGRTADEVQPLNGSSRFPASLSIVRLDGIYLNGLAPTAASASARAIAA